MLNIKNFEVEAVDEITAQVDLWGQQVVVTVCVELDEDDEERYITKAVQVIDENIEILNDRIKEIEGKRAEILKQLMEEDPMIMVQSYIDNHLNGVVATYFTLEDGTEVKLPLSEEEFISKLLVCESIYVEIVAMEEDEEAEMNMSVGFGVKNDLIGGHGWDIDVE